MLGGFWRWSVVVSPVCHSAGRVAHDCLFGEMRGNQSSKRKLGSGSGMLATFGVKLIYHIPIVMYTKERDKRKGDAIVLADDDMDLGM